MLRPNRLLRRRTLREKRNSLRPSLSSLYADFINRAIIIVMFYTTHAVLRCGRNVGQRAWILVRFDDHRYRPPLSLSLSVSLFSPPPDPNENYRRGNFGAVEFFVEKRKSRGEMVHRLTAIGGFLRYVGCCGREEGRRRKRKEEEGRKGGLSNAE